MCGYELPIIGQNLAKKALEQVKILLIDFRGYFLTHLVCATTLCLEKCHRFHMFDFNIYERILIISHKYYWESKQSKDALFLFHLTAASALPLGKD